MPKLTLADLKKLRDEKRASLARREGDKLVHIIVGMGTCGIAAGARKTFDAFVDELDNAGFADAVVKQTGCLGQCWSEPTVEVHVEGMPDIIYGKVDIETARRIVRKHVMERTLVQDHIFDRPAGDIVAGGSVSG